MPDIEHRDPTFLTVKQVSEWLQVSTKSVTRWAAADPTMPVLRIGKTIRFDKDRLTNWLRAKSQGIPSARSHKRTHTEVESHATA